MLSNAPIRGSFENGVATMPNPLRTEAERIVDDAIQLVVVQTPAKSPNEPWESFVENLRAQLYISVELALTRVQQAQRETLRRYLRHEEGCPAGIPGHGRGHCDTCVCDCGLDAALSQGEAP